MVGQRELTREDLISLVRRRWLLIALLAAVGGAIGYGTARALPKRYTSQTLVLVEQPTVPRDYVQPVVSASVNERLASMQQEILSRTRLEPLIQQFGLYHEDANQAPMEDLVERLRKNIAVTAIQPMAETRSQGLPGFSISVQFSDPRLAQQLCSTITSMFMEENLRFRTQEAEQTSQFIAKQLDDAKTKLDEQDGKLAEFKRRYLGSLPDEEQTNMNIWMGLSSQLDAVTQALNRAHEDKTFAQSVLTQQLSEWQKTLNGQNPETLEEQRTALQAHLETLRSKYTDDYPDVRKAAKDLEALNEKISKADEQDPAAASGKRGRTPVEPSQVQSLRNQLRQYDQLIQEKTAQQEEIQKQINVYQARVQSSPAIEQEYKELTRDYQTALDFYNDLLRKKDQSAMATDLERRQQGEQFRVLDPANLPDAPSFPKMSAFLSGGMSGGLALGLALAFLLEFQDSSVRSERDIEYLIHLPVIATVPTIRPLTGRKVKGTLKLVARS